MMLIRKPCQAELVKQINMCETHMQHHVVSDELVQTLHFILSSINQFYLYILYVFLTFFLPHTRNIVYVFKLYCPLRVPNYFSF